MLPQVLLFSSDQQVAELVLALLPEFGMEVEHRPDVFGAIERLTSRSYQLLVVDWKERLEASFLLKTARELTATRTTPVVAVVDQQDVSEALKVGADAVLVRPFSFEQARSTFAALPQVSRERRSTGRTDSRQSVDLGVSETRHTRIGYQNLGNASVSPVRRTTITKAPSFAGYAENPNRASSKHLKNFAIAALAIGGLGMLAPHYQPWTAQLRNALHVSHFIVNSAVHSATAKDAGEPHPDTNPYAAVSIGTSTAPALGTQLNSRGLRPANKAIDSASREARNSSPEMALDITRQALQPEVPESLLVPIQAMTARPPETKLSSSGPRWSLDPPLLPEETARALLVRQILPKYPQPALAAGIEGTVMLRALVGKDGIVHDLKLVQGPLIFGRCAYEAVKNWRYRPYLLNGEAIEMQTLITVNFSRGHNPALANKLP